MRASWITLFFTLLLLTTAPRVSVGQEGAIRPGTTSSAPASQVSFELPAIPNPRNVETLRSCPECNHCHSCTCAFDESGKPLTWEIADFGGGDVVSRWTFEYDNEGNPFRWRSAGSGQVKEWSFEYDEQGRCTSAQLMIEGAFAPPVRRTTVSFDEQGRPVVLEAHDGDTLAFRSTFDHDSVPGAIIEERDQDGDGTTDARAHHSIDEQGNRVRESIEAVATDGHQSFRFATFFNSDGQILREETDRDGDGQPETVCSFDPPCPVESDLGHELRMFMLVDGLVVPPTCEPSCEDFSEE